jgi:HEPN domain-containing protein
VLASLEMCWHFQRLYKNLFKLRKVLTFAEKAVKYVLASLGRDRHSLKELLKKCWQA